MDLKNYFENFKSDIFSLHSLQVRAVSRPLKSFDSILLRIWYHSESDKKVLEEVWAVFISDYRIASQFLNEEILYLRQ